MLEAMLADFLAKNQELIFRFLVGTLGSLVYFVSVKSGFVKTEDVREGYRNPYLEQKRYVIFFCFIGGVLAVLFEMNLLGSFIQGIVVRPTIKELIDKGTSAREGSNG